LFTAVVHSAKQNVIDSQARRSAGWGARCLGRNVIDLLFIPCSLLGARYFYVHSQICEVCTSTLVRFLGTLLIRSGSLALLVIFPPVLLIAQM